VANIVAQQMLGQDYEKVISMEVIDPAMPPTSPIAPQPVRLLTLGLVFGLILGVAFALMEHALSVLRSGIDILDGKPLILQQPALSSVEATVPAQHNASSEK
jgi:capsular polysaccharide biosynthesis protein